MLANISASLVFSVAVRQGPRLCYLVESKQRAEENPDSPAVLLKLMFELINLKFFGKAPSLVVFKIQDQVQMATVGQTMRRLVWLTFARQAYPCPFGLQHAESRSGDQRKAGEVTAEAAIAAAHEP